jgi:hypothetical protein
MARWPAQGLREGGWGIRLQPLPTVQLSNVLQLMGKNKVLVKVNPEGKYVVDLGECRVHAAVH